MGYMGFGMRKEVYTRRPKSLYSHIKKIYGERLEEYYPIKIQTGKWSDKDKKDFRNFIHNKIRRNIISDNFYNNIVNSIIFVIVAMTFYFALQLFV